MRVDDFDFDLPQDLIALRPVEPRDAARMLHVANGTIADETVRRLPQLLRAGDVMVFNDTKVIPAQLFGVRAPRSDAPLGASPDYGGPKIEITLHKRAGLNVWWAFARPAKKLEEGDRLTLGGRLGAYVKQKGEAGEVLLAFEEEGPALDLAIAEAGTTPLPPYIARKRAADERDKIDYQTVYARQDGSVAAPTAGLHFTEHLLSEIEAAGIVRETVTLHVGAGTFLPVKAQDTDDHVMHSEWGTVTAEAAERINAAKAKGGRIVCVGTTSLRLIESAAAEDGRIQAFSGDTDLFITPGYSFKAADVLMTNFHLPKSTLFMLVSAFAGTAAMRRAYEHAVSERYRFYSYGDSSLLFRTDDPQ